VDVWSVIANITALLGVALGLGAIAQRLKQSALVGYLLAGLLLGPGGLGVIDDPGTISTFAELGVVLLIFSIGLELPATRIRALGATALLAGSLQIIVTVVVVAVGCGLAGMAWPTAWALGLVVAPSSTACVMRLLEQRTELDSMHGRSATGILLLQDAALVPLILGMSLLGGGGGADGAAAGGAAAGATSGGMMLLGSFARMAGLMALLYLVIRYMLPFALDQTTVSRNRELPLLLAIVVVLGAAWSAHALGVSPVLGAFAAGILLAESPYALWIRADVGSFRTVFLTLFFASLAMMDDLSWVRTHFVRLLIAVPLVLGVKALVVVGVTRFSGLPLRAGMAAGLCLAQTGEFSFVLAQIGVAGGVIPSAWGRLIIGTTVVGLLVTPSLLVLAARVARIAETGGHRLGDDGHDLHDHVVVIGTGPAGQAVYESLVGRIPMALVDLSPRLAQFERNADVHLIRGDATQETVLSHAGVERARAIVVTLPDHTTALRVIELIAAIAPRAAVLTRARTHRYAPLLHASSTEVIDEELEVGRALAERTSHVIGVAATG
jgi:CPA2 family monovalent cation:H+ antiporter-2